MDATTLNTMTRAQLLALLPSVGIDAAPFATATKDVLVAVLVAVGKPAKARGETLAERRARGAFVCSRHTDCGKDKNGHFANENGLNWHLAHSKAQ